jgi:hypothetical protein
MPERSTSVVVNTTPIMALSLIGKLDVLRQLYGEVTIPPAVHSEVLTGGARIGSAELTNATWIRVIPLRDPQRADLLLADLDRSEAEVIALAQETNAELVVLDERLARQHARRLGLRLTGTLGVLVKAKQGGLIPAVAPLVADLRRGGIWLSDALVEEALRLADEL